MKEPEVHHPHGMNSLSAAVASLQARVARLEEHLGLTPAVQSEATTVTVPAEVEPLDIPATSHSSPQLPSLGFAFLILAGAFLLRALTENRVVDGTFGIILGLAYTLILLFLTNRAAARGDSSRATLFGLATTLVAYPLVWETATRLSLLPPSGAAGIIVLVTGLGLSLAVRHSLRGLAWFILLATLTTLIGLYWAADQTTLFAALIVALGVATVWLGYLQDWQGPQWLVASVANFLVFLTVMLASRPADQLPDGPKPAPDAVIPLALALPVVYLGSFSLRTMLQKREAGVFEITQSLGCLLAGYLGAVRLLRIGDGSTVALGWATLVAAAAGYGVAFTFVRQRQGRGLNFFYHAWLGLLLTMLGTALVVSGVWLPYLWGGLAVAVAVAGGRYDRWTLRLHCAAYLIGATALTGLPAVVFDAFVAPASRTWHSLSGPGIVVWLAAIACYGLLVATHRRCELSTWRRLPRFLIAVIVLVGAGSLLVTTLAAWLTDRITGQEGATVAVVRTAVLAATAMGLGAVSRHQPIIELAWFVNPLLVLTGLKLLLEDLRRGTPISLFFGFTLFGVALIVTSRLHRLESRAKL